MPCAAEVIYRVPFDTLVLHFLAFAHLAFWAAAIRARPSGLIFLRFRVETFPSLRGSPRFSGGM